MSSASSLMMNSPVASARPSLNVSHRAQIDWVRQNPDPAISGRQVPGHGKAFVRRCVIDDHDVDKGAVLHQHAFDGGPQKAARSCGTESQPLPSGASLSPPFVGLIRRRTVTPPQHLWFVHPTASSSVCRTDPETFSQNCITRAALGLMVHDDVAAPVHQLLQDAAAHRVVGPLQQRRSPRRSGRSHHRETNTRGPSRRPAVPARHGAPRVCPPPAGTGGPAQSPGPGPKPPTKTIHDIDRSYGG